MRTVFLVLGLFLLSFVLAAGVSAENRQCQDGTFYLGDPLSTYRVKLSGYCVDWDAGTFTGLFPHGRSLERDLGRLEPLVDSRGQTVRLVRPTRMASTDSLYEALKTKPLDQMSDREYEYFMLKKKAETESGSQTTTARAAMMQAESTRSMVNTYITISLIGLALTVVGFLLIW